MWQITVSLGQSVLNNAHFFLQFNLEETAHTLFPPTSTFASTYLMLHTLDPLCNFNLRALNALSETACF